MENQEVIIEATLVAKHCIISEEKIQEIKVTNKDVIMDEILEADLGLPKVTNKEAIHVENQEAILRRKKTLQWKPY